MLDLSCCRRSLHVIEFRLLHQPMCTPVRELRSELSQVIDQVADLREPVIVTRHGRPAAVLVPVDEYEALEETAEILSDAETMAAVEEGRREAERGETVTLGELRQDLRSRRRT